MFAAAMLGILVTMFLALIAAVRGPTVFDRILAINLFSSFSLLTFFFSALFCTFPTLATDI